jgi:hypothetical protein
MQPTVIQPRYCRQCGHVLQPGEHFCPSCGSAIRGIAMPSTQPGSPTVQPRPRASSARKMPSWGWLIALAMALFLFASLLYTTWKAVVAFDPALVLSTQGKCQITQSRVQHFTNPWVHTGSNVNIPRQQMEYKAQVSYTLLTADGRTFQGSSYDWMDDARVNEGPDQAQAIVSQYQVGHTYPCWYNALVPALSALRQSVDWSLDPFDHATLPFIVGGFVWVLVLVLGLPVATIMTVARSWSWSRRKAAP